MSEKRKLTIGYVLESKSKASKGIEKVEDDLLKKTEELHDLQVQVNQLDREFESRMNTIDTCDKILRLLKAIDDGYKCVKDGLLCTPKSVFISEKDTYVECHIGDDLKEVNIHIDKFARFDEGFSYYKDKDDNVKI